MSFFYETGSGWQGFLLVLSQLAVISLAAALLLLLRRKCSFRKLLGVGAVFLINAALYLVMQLDSRITDTGHGPELCLPYVLALAAVVSSLVFTFWAILSETKNRRTINQDSIREAFDNLPAAVCFFNESGLPVLCNRAMHRFSFAVCGKDVQFITDLEGCLSGETAPVPGVRKEKDVFVLGDGSAWKLEKHAFDYENSGTYVEYVALDITDLQRNREELIRENRHLRMAQEELKRLSANVVAVTREEEILNTKMRLHDEMGRCLLAAEKYLRAENAGHIPDSVVASWQRAVSMLKYNNDTPDEDMLSQIRSTCQWVKMDFVQTGSLPKQEKEAYLLTCAVRECVTNAVRYAHATQLYAVFSETPTEASVTVTNNGIPPRQQIVEGGGLSTLRRRIERSGGTMYVQSLPSFRLTVTVPKGKEGPV